MLHNHLTGQRDNAYYHQIVEDYCNIVVHNELPDDDAISQQLQKMGYNKNDSNLTTAMVPHAFFRFVFEGQLNKMENYYFIMDFDTKNYTVHYLENDDIYQAAIGYAPKFLELKGQELIFKIIQYSSEINAIRDIMSKGAEVELKNLSMLPLTVQKW